MNNMFSSRKVINNLPEHVQKGCYPPHRRMHLSNYDYQTPGAYAITICAHNRHDNLFDIPVVKNLLKEEWRHLPQHFVGITLDIHIIMPDHIHCIIWHNERKEKTKSIIDVIKGYKSLCTIAWRRYTNELKGDYDTRLWQNNFYDHIIRNEEDLKNQRTYMLNNPLAAVLKKGKIEIKEACEYNSCGHIPFPPE